MTRKGRGGDRPAAPPKATAAGDSQPPTPTTPTESLDDYPAAFADTDVMPWEEGPPVVRWPWGYDKGTPLESMVSPELLRRRKQLEELIIAIDTILTERAGE